MQDTYSPPWFLDNGFLMTLYVAWRSSQTWQESLGESEPHYQKVIFSQGEVPLAGWVAIPENPKGTVVANLWHHGNIRKISGFSKFWRGKLLPKTMPWCYLTGAPHGESIKLSSVLTSDGINEGKDFVNIAAESKTFGCPAPFWFTGYSLGGQLALWGIYYSQFLEVEGITSDEIMGGAVICPNLDSNLSLPLPRKSSLREKYIEQAIAKELQKLVFKIQQYYPQEFESR